MFWLGRDGAGTELMFVNDLRFGDNSYRPESRFSQAWYVTDGKSYCSVAQETRRSYGPTFLQTVDLTDTSSNGTTSWSVSTGRARTPSGSVVGNWLP